MSPYLACEGSNSVQYNMIQKKFLGESEWTKGKEKSHNFLQENRIKWISES